MRLTIIPSDSAVYVDGESRIVNLNGCEIPSNVHALQWYDTKGWIEFSDDGDPFTPRPPNEDITELPQWAMSCVAKWEENPPPPLPPPDNTEQSVIEA